MSKRRKFASFLVLGLAVAAIAFFARRQSGPMALGKPLSRWLVELDQQTPNKNAQATQAVQQIGTNALPILLTMIQSRDPWLTKQLTRITCEQTLNRLHLSSARQQRRRALLAFRLLRSTAKPAIPALCELLSDRETGGDAAAALAMIGPDAAPHLIEARTNKNRIIAGHALRGLQEMVDGYGIDVLNQTGPTSSSNVGDK
jgi:hypothetical protein